MSGGSYNYLYRRLDPEWMTYASPNELLDMAADVRRDYENSEQAEEIAKELEAAAEQLQAVMDTLESLFGGCYTDGPGRLSYLLRAIEWEASADWSEKQVLNVWAAYKKNRAERETEDLSK